MNEKNAKTKLPKPLVLAEKQPMKDQRVEDELPDFSNEIHDFCPSRDRDYGPLER